MTATQLPASPTWFRPCRNLDRPALLSVINPDEPDFDVGKNSYMIGKVRSSVRVKVRSRVRVRVKVRSRVASGLGSCVCKKERLGFGFEVETRFFPESAPLPSYLHQKKKGTRRLPVRPPRAHRDIGAVRVHAHTCLATALASTHALDSSCTSTHASGRTNHIVFHNKTFLISFSALAPPRTGFPSSAESFAKRAWPKWLHYGAQTKLKPLTCVSPLVVSASALLMAI